MKPVIDQISFASITVDNKEFTHDIIIRLDGSVERRNKKLSKQIFGNAHKLARNEAKHLYEEDADLIIIGNGLFGELHLSQEAQDYFNEKSCQLEILNSKKAIIRYNKAEGRVIGLFHTTC